jgi:hypothetical protein
MTPTQDSKQKLFDSGPVWSLIKLFPILVALSYASGYIVTKSYLDTLGVKYVSPLNASFLAPGFMILLVVLLIVYCTYNTCQYVTTSLKEMFCYLPVTLCDVVYLAGAIALAVTEHYDSSAIFPSSAGPMCIGGAALVFFLYLAKKIIDKDTVSNRNLARVLCTCTAMALAIGIFFFYCACEAAKLLMVLLIGTSFTALMAMWMYQSGLMPPSMPLTILFFSFFLCVCPIFGRGVYKDVPRYLGGGRPYSACLSVRAEYSHGIAAMGFQIIEGRTVPKATIAYEDENIYVITNEQGSHVIAKNIIMAVSSVKGEK